MSTRSEMTTGSATTLPPAKRRRTRAPRYLMDDEGCRFLDLDLLTRRTPEGRDEAARAADALSNMKLARWLALRYAEWIYHTNAWEETVSSRELIPPTPPGAAEAPPPPVTVAQMLESYPEAIHELCFELWDFEDDTVAHAEIARYGFTDIIYARRNDDIDDDVDIGDQTHLVHIRF